MLKPSRCSIDSRDSRKRSASAGPARQRGFTLIELLVVLTILALLVGFGVKNVGKFMEQGNRAKTASILSHLEGLLEQYRNQTGDYPPNSLSQFGVRSTNTLNEGNEALVLAFFQQTYNGNRIDESYLSTNLDNDRADKNISTFGEPVLLEVVDGWGNPFIYIRHDGMAGEYEYEFMVAETMTTELRKVKAFKNPTTGSFYDQERYQLISVGEDGVFDTDDDIRSYGK